MGPQEGKFLYEWTAGLDIYLSVFVRCCSLTVETPKKRGPITVTLLFVSILRGINCVRMPYPWCNWTGHDANAHSNNDSVYV